MRTHSLGNSLDSWQGWDSMAKLSKFIQALLAVEKEDPDKRPIYVEIPESQRLYKVKKIHDEKDRVVLIARRSKAGED